MKPLPYILLFLLFCSVASAGTKFTWEDNEPPRQRIETQLDILAMDMEYIESRAKYGKLMDEYIMAYLQLKNDVMKFENETLQEDIRDKVLVPLKSAYNVLLAKKYLGQEEANDFINAARVGVEEVKKYWVGRDRAMTTNEQLYVIKTGLFFFRQEEYDDNYIEAFNELYTTYIKYVNGLSNEDLIDAVHEKIFPIFDDINYICTNNTPERKFIGRMIKKAINAYKDIQNKFLEVGAGIRIGCEIVGPGRNWSW